MTPSIYISSEPSNTTISEQIDGTDQDVKIENGIGKTDDNISDYGDFGNDDEELEIIDQLLSHFNARPDDEQALFITDIEDYEAPRGVHLPKVLGIEKSQQGNSFTSYQVPGQVLPDFKSSNTETRKELDNETKDQSPVPDRIDQQSIPSPDTRSPLERFRRPPKKALSVTDLVSPAWCELQYFYTLSKHGKKRRTPAMKQGSTVHQALEDEVHTTVPIEITTKEDSWGLRIWNVIQGLKTLRETGRTRELEVWGTIGGEMVNGVIDELSFECPDPKLEQQSQKLLSIVGDPTSLPEYQTSITEYFLSDNQLEQGTSITEAMSTETEARPHRQSSQDNRRIYITDLKTRGRSSLPKGSSIRPTILQLHLYHHLLENLAQGTFPLTRLVERYDLDPYIPFSDSFIVQVGSLNDNILETISPSDEPRSSPNISSQSSMDLLLHHNNLSSLWDLMMAQFRQTFVLSTSQSNVSTQTTTSQSDPDLSPTSSPTRLSPLLTVEYISQSYLHVAGAEKSLLGRKSFIFNASFLKSYLEDNLAWWRGERSAKGVELQEAWKCRSCDFRDDCEWIHERDLAAYNEVLERKKMREIAGVENVGMKRSEV